MRKQIYLYNVQRIREAVVKMLIKKIKLTQIKKTLSDEENKEFELLKKRHKTCVWLLKYENIIRSAKGFNQLLDKFSGVMKNEKI